MANNYIKTKWQQWFRTMDINHRGEISKADANDNAEKFAQLSRMNENQKKKMKENLQKVWDDLVFRGRSGGINEEKFVETNTKLYIADKAKFQDEMRKVFTTLYTDVIDADHDGFITENDFVNSISAAGHDNISLIKEFFLLFNPEEGRVSVKALIDSWVQFTTSDDSAKRDIVKEGIESVV